MKDWTGSGLVARKIFIDLASIGNQGAIFDEIDSWGANLKVKSYVFKKIHSGLLS